jgi:predicted AlkP superfamily pyrophosphatase or phosphodiesterase
VWASPYRAADRVVVVSLDGLRPDAIDASTATLSRLIAEGASARHARTVHPSVTLPAHASMLSGAAPEAHGITHNHPSGLDRLRVPTVLHVARAAGMQTSLFLSKQKLDVLAGGEAPDVMQIGGLRCTRILPAAERHLRAARTGVHFVHFADPDSAGHAHGFMSGPYRDAVQRADGCLARLIAVVEEHDVARTLVIVTADHGGHGRTHGSDEEQDMRIPWIAWGAGIGPGQSLGNPVAITDTAATVLFALGLPLPEFVAGRPAPLWSMRPRP